MPGKRSWTKNKGWKTKVLLVAIIACGTGTEPDNGSAAPPSTVAPISIPAPVETTQARTMADPLEASPAWIQAQQTLETVLRTHGTDPDNPWGIGHSLMALGSGLKLSNDEDAVQWLFKHYATRTPLGDTWVLSFPASKDNRPVEAHPGQILKALTDAGVSPRTEVMVDGHAHTTGDLYRGVLAMNWYDSETGRSSFKETNDMPWALFGLANWSAPGMTWTDDQGHTTTLTEITNHASMTLSTATRFLAEAAQKKTQFTKQGQGIFKYTCGGAHLIQGVTRAKLRGFGLDTSDGPFRHQLRLLQYRFPQELAQIDAGAKASPGHAIPLAVQRLKLCGHTLETLGQLAVSGHPDAPTPEEMQPIADEIFRSVALLERLSVFKNLHIIKTENEQLFLDVIGDSAHALRGLRIASGEAPVYY
jgi:hypothetical protein